MPILKKEKIKKQSSKSIPHKIGEKLGLIKKVGDCSDIKDPKQKKACIAQLKNKKK